MGFNGIYDDIPSGNLTWLLKIWPLYVYIYKYIYLGKWNNILLSWNKAIKGDGFPY